MKTIDKIIEKVNCQYGAPMGRANVGQYPSKLVPGARVPLPRATHVFDCAVPMSGDRAYDKGGAYWGIGKQLRVRYTKDLTYIHFYRVGDEVII